MKVALFQGEGVCAAPDENIEIMRQAASDAAEKGAELIVFPELFLSGYNLGAEAASQGEEEGSRNSKRIVDIAQNYAIAVLYGYVEREGERLYISAKLIQRDGSTLLNHRKCQLFGGFEQSSFQEGSSFEVARLGDFTLGFLICYEVEFPEAVRALAAKGANLVIVLSATSEPYSWVPEVMVPTRALENQIYLVFSNRCGREGDLVYCGGSRVVGPDGQVLGALGKEEGLIFAQLETERIASSRARFDYLSDLRQDLYR